MPAWKHRLTEKNADTSLGICQSCGPVTLSPRRRGGRVQLRCALAVREQRGRPSRVNRDKYTKGPHGLTADQARAFRDGKSCALCGSTNNLCVDHCHDSLQIRDVLCRLCNSGLGMFRDRPDLLRAAAEYVEFHKQ